MIASDLSQIANQVLDRCESTNDCARLLGEAGYPHGTWVSARVQERGRGRLGRDWQSLEGNLFLSMVLRLEAKSLWTWVPLAVAVAVAEALREIDSRLDVRIKWPNDLWLGGAKLGGILCEAVGSPKGSFIVMGLGLNCIRAPQGLDQGTASLASVVKSEKILVDSVRPGVMSAVLAKLNALVNFGSKPIRESYSNFAAIPQGTAIEWGSDNHGLVQGLGESGELIVLHDEKGPVSLFAEDVKIRLRYP